MINLINQAIEKINSLENKKPFKVQVGPKWYTTVATRVEIFRNLFGSSANIKTELVSADVDMVCMKATICLYQNGVWEEVATGFAEEFRGEGMVNKTSALENCETSAIGRALANLGIHGGEFASAFEVDNAVNNKSEPPKKYSLVSPEGEDLGIYVGIPALIKILRNNLGVAKPEQSHTDFYNCNRETIIGAYKDAEGKNKEVLGKLLGVYDPEQLEDA